MPAAPWQQRRTLLIAKAPMKEAAINNARIAIPGKYTANFLLSLVYPSEK